MHKMLDEIYLRCEIFQNGFREDIAGQARGIAHETPVNQRPYERYGGLLQFLVEPFTQLGDAPFSGHARTENGHPFIGAAALEYATGFGTSEVDPRVDAQEHHIIAQPGADSRQRCPVDRTHEIPLMAFTLKSALPEQVKPWLLRLSISPTLRGQRFETNAGRTLGAEGLERILGIVNYIAFACSSQADPILPIDWGVQPKTYQRDTFLPLRL
ncbi:hypothetical protein [Streptomyces sp. NTH33]|uniref:hypothetical protein n=1 Tax=Streptomyces sp. NTH33 TaxID=1735453 RepID=UPI0015E8DEC7|nr:hypothetical protein [Streptomyces sp. NTH33]